ncbi:MB12A protein, partial [Atractosteus spatula]|nr:MB12A protein [Atractosteus spatula]
MQQDLKRARLRAEIKRRRDRLDAETGRYCKYHPHWPTGHGRRSKRVDSQQCIHQARSGWTVPHRRELVSTRGSWTDPGVQRQPHNPEIRDLRWRVLASKSSTTGTSPLQAEEAALWPGMSWALSSRVPRSGGVTTVLPSPSSYCKGSRTRKEISAWQTGGPDSITAEQYRSWYQAQTEPQTGGERGGEGQEESETRRDMTKGTEKEAMEKEERNWGVGRTKRENQGKTNGQQKTQTGITKRKKRSLIFSPHSCLQSRRQENINSGIYLLIAANAMSFPEHAPPAPPVTAMAWTSSANTCPPEFRLITATHEGSAAHFVKGFGLKSGYYLCFSTSVTAGMVVQDIRIVSDKETIPHGYCYIPEYLDNKVSVLKKKRLCVKTVPWGSTDTAVLDIKLTSKSRVILPHYTCLGYESRAPHSSLSLSAVKPRSISVDMGKLSLDKNSPAEPLHQRNSSYGHPLGKLTRRRSNLEVMDMPIYDTSNIYGISAMDGVPFALHPKFDTQMDSACSVNVQLTKLNNIRIKSLQDIENEYDYTFSVEKSAASRTSPMLSQA